MGPQGSAVMVNPRSADKHFTLAELILVIILGALAIFVALGFLLVYLSRRRQVQHRNDGLMIGYTDQDDEADETASSSPGSQSRRRRLRKARTPTTAPSSPSEKADDGAEGPWRFSSIKRTSLPILPPLFTKRRSIFNPFAAGPAQASDRRTSAWIDADALHGPKVKKARDSKRYSIRESWPLRAMAPTLPKLTSASSSSALLATYESHHSLLIAGRDGFPLPSSRGLPRAPRPVLIPRGVVVAAAAANLSPTKRSGGSVGGVLRSIPPGARTRNVSTDSTLSQILRSTEQRLQEGGTSGVARRNRLSASPTKTGTPARESGPGVMSDPIDDGSTTTLYRGSGGDDGCSSRTPSPGKTSQGRQGESPIHTRQSSVGSEADSLLDGASPLGELPTGLSSPSRVAAAVGMKRPDSSSPISSLSSALSTVYSEDEMQEGTTQFTSVHSSSILDGAKMQTQTPASSDPFVSSTPARPNRDWPVSPECRSLAELNRPLRLRGQSHHSSPGRRGESAYSVSNNMSSDELLLSPPSGHHYSNQQHGARPLPSPHVPDTPESVICRATTAASPSWLRERPSVFVTSPSTASMASSTPQSLPTLTYNGARADHDILDSPTQRRVYPPPLNLPSVDREPSLVSDDDDSMPPLPGSPELSLVKPQQSRDSLISSSSAEDDSPMLHEMPGTTRIVSTDSSNYSGAMAAAAATTTESGSLMRLNSVSIHVSKLPTTQMDVVMTPTNGKNHPLRLASTIAELRRMNSQISAYSDASSAYSGASVVSRLPVRTGGTSTRHYLTLGNSNANGARGRGRPATGMRASILVEEETTGCGGEKENEGGETKLAKMGLGHVNIRRGGGRSPSRNGTSSVSPRKGARSPDRMSVESLGLYDGDGFLISSPLRA